MIENLSDQIRSEYCEEFKKEYEERLSLGSQTSI
jgi:hypothetical protein